MPDSREPKKPDDASNHSDCRDPRASGGMENPYNSNTDNRKENDPSPAKCLPGCAPHSSECVKSGSGTLVHCHAVFSPAIPSPIQPAAATTDSQVPAPLPLLTPPPSRTSQSHFSLPPSDQAPSEPAHLKSQIPTTSPGPRASVLALSQNAPSEPVRRRLYRGRDGALACSTPPSEPDGRISRIRLSDW